MTTVQFTLRARAQMKAIHTHIAADNPAAADRVARRIEFVAALLGQHPHMGHRLRYRAERMIPVRTYPYVIFYVVQRGKVFVTRVLHSARRRPALQEPHREFRAAV